MLLKNPSLPSLYRCGRVSGTPLLWVGANRGDWDEFHSRKFEESLLELKVIKLSFFSSSSPNLTWRDVQHIIANSARAAPGGVWLKQGHWLQNKAGFHISNVYGFGLMDAEKMVMLASKWKEVPEQIKCEIEGIDKDMWASSFSSFFFFAFPFSETETHVLTCADLTGFLRLVWLNNKCRSHRWTIEINYLKVEVFEKQFNDAYPSFRFSEQSSPQISSVKTLSPLLVPHVILKNC